MTPLTSQDLTREINSLEKKLSGARERADSDAAAYSALEEQVVGLRKRLEAQRGDIALHEARLAAKREELAEAKRIEALERYDDSVAAWRAAAETVVRAADELLEAVNSYDDETLRLRRLLGEMREAFGADDERVGKVEAILADESAALKDAWADVSGTVGWRVSRDDPDDDERPDLFLDLQGETRERPRARIMEYFGRS